MARRIALALVLLIATQISNLAAQPSGLTAAQTDNLAQYISQCYRGRARERDQGRQVRVIVTTDPNGEARQAEIAPGDPAYPFGSRLHAFGELAVRAILAPACSRLPLPATALGRPQRFGVTFRG